MLSAVNKETCSNVITVPVYSYRIFLGEPCGSIDLALFAKSKKDLATEFTEITEKYMRTNDLTQPQLMRDSFQKPREPNLH